jgi:hypothetical protein
VNPRIQEFISYSNYQIIRHLILLNIAGGPGEAETAGASPH